MGAYAVDAEAMRCAALWLTACFLASQFVPRVDAKATVADTAAEICRVVRTGSSLACVVADFHP